jgi:hypothetical protein
MAHAYLKTKKTNHPCREPGFSLAEAMVATAFLCIVSVLAAKSMKNSAKLISSEESAQGFVSLNSVIRGEIANSIGLFVKGYASGTKTKLQLSDMIDASSSTISGMSYNVVKSGNLISGTYPSGSTSAMSLARCNQKSPTFTANTLYLCVKWTLTKDAIAKFGNSLDPTKPIFVELLYTMQDTKTLQNLAFTNYLANANGGGRLYFWCLLGT